MTAIFNANETNANENEQEVPFDPKAPKTKLKAKYLEKLTAEQQVRQLAFRDYRVTHSALRRVTEDLMPLLMTPSETNVIVVTGATGVGKSTLTNVMLNKLVDDFDPLIEEDSTAVPLAYVCQRSA